MNPVMLRWFAYYNCLFETDCKYVRALQARRHPLKQAVWLFKACCINTKDIIISRCIYCVLVCLLAKTCRTMTIIVAWFLLGGYFQVQCFHLFPLSLTGTLFILHTFAFLADKNNGALSKIIPRLCTPPPPTGFYFQLCIWTSEIPVTKCK